MVSTPVPYSYGCNFETQRPADQVFSQGHVNRCKIPTANLDALARNPQNVEEKLTDHPAKNKPHPNASLYYLGWTAVFENNLCQYMQDVLCNDIECITY